MSPTLWLSGLRLAAHDELAHRRGYRDRLRALDAWRFYVDDFVLDIRIAKAMQFTAMEGD